MFKFSKNEDKIYLKRTRLFYLPPLKTTDGSVLTTIKIDTTFVSDGASIPKFLWSVVGHPFEAKYREAAFVHDYLYKTKVVPRKEADKGFYYLLRLNNGKIKSWLFYRAVRLFGGKHYE